MKCVLYPFHLWVLLDLRSTLGCSKEVFVLYGLVSFEDVNVFVGGVFDNG